MSSKFKKYLSDNKDFLLMFAGYTAGVVAMTIVFERFTTMAHHATLSQLIDRVAQEGDEILLKRGEETITVAMKK